MIKISGVQILNEDAVDVKSRDTNLRRAKELIEKNPGSRFRKGSQT